MELSHSKKTSRKLAKRINTAERALELYRNQAPLLYAMLRLFQSSQTAQENIKKLAIEICDHYALTPYEKYGRQLCLRILYNFTLVQGVEYKPAQTFSELSKEEFFALALVDGHDIPADEVASACKTSVGTIETRLQLARKKTFYSTRESRAYFNEHQSEPIALELLEVPVDYIITRDKKGWQFNLTGAPWYYKIVFEGLLATTLVLSIIFSIPKVRKGYEFWVERRLDLYNLAEFNTTTDSIPTGQAQVAATSPTNSPSSLPLSSSTQDPLATTTPAASSTENAPNAQPTPQSKMVSESEFGSKTSQKATSDKIYRVFVKTDNPEATKNTVLSTLSQLQFTPAIQGSAVSELPGGIMIDFFIPLTQYPQFVKQIPSYGDVKQIETRSKEKIIPGKAHIKIFIQRM